MTYITKLGEKNPLLGCLQENHIDLMINFCVIFLGLVSPPPPPKEVTPIFKIFYLSIVLFGVVISFDVT